MNRENMDEVEAVMAALDPIGIPGGIVYLSPNSEVSIMINADFITSGFIQIEVTMIFCK
jgi:hypothetical protein